MKRPTLAEECNATNATIGVTSGSNRTFKNVSNKKIYGMHIWCIPYIFHHYSKPKE
jgi:hypothetical protein